MSSSSCFTVAKITSKMIAEILEEYYDELQDQMIDIGGNIMILPNGEIEVSRYETYYDAPKTLMDILHILLEMIDDNYMYIDGNDIGVSNCSELVQRLLRETEFVVDSIERAEITIMADGDDELEDDIDDEYLFDDISDTVGLETIVTTYDKKTGVLNTHRTFEQD